MSVTERPTLSVANPPAGRPPAVRETLGLMIGFVGIAIFGLTLPMTRIAVEVLNPVFATTGRAVIAGVLALIVLGIARRPLPRRDQWQPLIVAAVCLTLGFPGFSGFAMQVTGASQAAVVIGIAPLAVAVCGSIAARQNPSRGFWVTALIGAALVAGFSLREGVGFSLGDVLMLGAVASVAIGYTVSGILSRSMAGWEVISWVVVIALPVTIPVSLMTMPADFAAVSARHWGAFLYIGVMSQYVGFFFWNAGLAMGGVARVSQVQLLQTFISLVAAATLNGEDVDGMTWAVAVAVVAVVLIGKQMGVSRVKS